MAFDPVTYALCKGSGSSLPPVSSTDNGKVLTVDDGAWAAGYRHEFEPNEIQHIPVSYDGSSFTTTISPKDVEDGFTYNGENQPSFANSSITVLDVYIGGVYALTIQLPIYAFNSDGPTFRSYILSGDGMGSPGKVFYLSLDSQGNDMPYIIGGCIWDKGGKFLVTLTPTGLDYSGTMDHTVAEINAAYEAGMEIVFNLVVSGYGSLKANVTLVGQTDPESDYPSFAAYLIDENNDVMVVCMTGFTNDGTQQTYSTTIYSLTPAS